MKIAVTCHPTQGGSGVVATELAQALGRRGHEVHIITDRRPFRLADDAPVQFHQVNVTDYPLFLYPPHGLSTANKLAEVVADHGIEVIHAHYAVPYAISAIVAREILAPHPVKVVSTLHGTDITLVGSNRDFYRICRYAMLKCNGLTTVSDWLRDRTMQEFKLPAPPAVIPNFVDCDRFNPVGRSGFPDDDVVQIVHASNFRPVKRVFDVVRVFARIREQRPARLLLVGEGPELGLARELCAELNVCQDVEFMGAQRNIEQILRRSHLFLLLSDYESFGLSALEAMACGVPAVASRSGGLTEVVKDGETGALCRVGDVEDIAARALQIVQDADHWQRISDNAVHHAQATFCRNKIVPRYESFYQRILEGEHLPTKG